MVCYIPATINRLYCLFNGKDNYILIYFQTVFDSLQGFFFAAVFGLNPQIRKIIREQIGKCCFKRKPSVSSIKSSEEKKNYETGFGFDESLNSSNFGENNNRKEKEKKLIKI